MVSCNLWTDDANKFIQSPSETAVDTPSLHRVTTDDVVKVIPQEELSRGDLNWEYWCFVFSIYWRPTTTCYVHNPGRLWNNCRINLAHFSIEIPKLKNRKNWLSLRLARESINPSVGMKIVTFPSTPPECPRCFPMTLLLKFILYTRSISKFTLPLSSWLSDLCASIAGGWARLNKSLA